MPFEYNDSRFLQLEENAWRGIQGHNAHHAENRHHDTLTAIGLTYSHTTIIRDMSGAQYAHHAYRFPNSEWCAGVNCKQGWPVNFSRLGSSSAYTTYGIGVAKYAKRKFRELQRVASK